MACFCRFINESIALEKRRKIVLTEIFKLNFSLKNEYNYRKNPLKVRKKIGLLKKVWKIQDYIKFKLNLII